MDRYIQHNDTVASGASSASFQLGNPYDDLFVYRGSMSTAAEMTLFGSYDGTTYYQMAYPREKTKVWKFSNTSIASGTSHISVTVGDPPGPVMVYRGSMSTGADVNIEGSFDATTYFQLAFPQPATSTSGPYSMYIGSGVTGLWMQYDVPTPYLRFVATDVVSGGVSIMVGTHKEPVTMVLPSGVTSVYSKFSGPLPPYVKFGASAVVSGGVSMSVVGVDHQ